jgi:hypothetical protein
MPLKLIPVDALVNTSVSSSPSSSRFPLPAGALYPEADKCVNLPYFDALLNRVADTYALQVSRLVAIFNGCLITFTVRRSAGGGGFFFLCPERMYFRKGKRREQFAAPNGDPGEL